MELGSLVYEITISDSSCGFILQWNVALMWTITANHNHSLFMSNFLPLADYFRPIALQFPSSHILQLHITTAMPLLIIIYMNNTFNKIYS